jgi:hypothetical protein
VDDPLDLIVAPGVRIVSSDDVVAVAREKQGVIFCAAG